MVGDDRAATGRGLGPHHPHQLALEHREALVQGQATRVAPTFMGRIVPGISQPQPLHGREQIGHRQHGEHVVATGIDDATQVFFFDHMAHHAEREVVERAGNGQMPVGRERPWLRAIGLDQGLPGGVLVETGLHLRMEALAVRDGVVVAAGEPAPMRSPSIMRRA